MKQIVIDQLITEILDPEGEGTYPVRITIIEGKDTIRGLKQYKLLIKREHLKILAQTYIKMSM